jgi:hypothetical protein
MPLNRIGVTKPRKAQICFLMGVLVADAHGAGANAVAIKTIQRHRKMTHLKKLPQSLLILPSQGMPPNPKEEVVLAVVEGVDAGVTDSVKTPK